MLCLFFVSDLYPRRAQKQPPIAFISHVHNRLAVLEVTAIAFRLSLPHKAPLLPSLTLHVV